MTTDNTGELYSEWFIIYLWAESQRAEEFRIFFVKSVTADGSLRSPTGGVEESYLTPHIHEQKTTSNYV